MFVQCNCRWKLVIKFVGGIVVACLYVDPKIFLNLFLLWVNSHCLILTEKVAKSLIMTDLCIHSGSVDVLRNYYRKANYSQRVFLCFHGIDEREFLVHVY